MIASRVIGIDLGTANTVVYLKGKGIVLREQSVVAKRVGTGDVEAVGDKASKMLGRTPEDIQAITPLQKGVIADFATTTALLHHFIGHIVNTKSPFSRKPNIMISVPAGATPVERRAVEEAAVQAGAKNATTIEATMAAAIGAGLPVDQPTGSMVVDIGAGTTEVAIVSLGGIVASTSRRVGGADMDQAIAQFIKRNHNLMIGDSTAELIKTMIGTAKAGEEDQSMTIRGRDVINGLPKSLEVSSRDVSSALSEAVREILSAIRETLENAPAELAADIVDSGIVLTGGGALLPQLDKVIAEETGLPVIMAENPQDCVAVGAGKTLDVRPLPKLKTRKR